MIDQIKSKYIEEWVKYFSEITEHNYEEPKHSWFVLEDRTWPWKRIDKAPIWASVDLRDWNQSIEKPMTIEQKLELFNILINMWFKEIEIWFPSASQEDYDFTRKLIEENRIPDWVKIGVLTQARWNLIKKTRESLEWAKNVIVHLYNSTSEVQREIVFEKSKGEIIKLAEYWIDEIKKNFSDFEWNIQLEYSPESFTWTEIEFAKDISNAVINKWDNFWKQDIILNLPSTIENSTPDVYADKIEYFVREFKYNRKKTNDAVNIIISIHPHNDRWTAVASAEFALKAWADRIEWTLLGNWERTWNVSNDILALNMMSQWINPELNFSNWWEYSEIISKIIDIKVPDRYPYIWRFVNLAFSGSHQDAIKKCFDFCKDKTWKWVNAYLPFNPEHIWLKYEPVKINSQSGKWWTAYILQQNWYEIPKTIQSFIQVKIQKRADEEKRMLESKEIVRIFEEEFINNIWKIDYSDFDENNFKWKWIIENFSKYISKKLNIEFKIKLYEQKAISEWKDSDAISYFIIEIDWKEFIWIWKDTDILEASKKWLISGINNFIKNK